MEGEVCPVCHKKSLTLTEDEKDIPYFGKCYLFSMNCSSCGYHKADVEAVEQHPPATYTLKINDEEDLKIRVIKSANATVKLQRIGSIEPGEASNGYITNVEGIINRLKKQIESLYESEEDDDAKQKCKALLKKINRIIWGRDSAVLTIYDPTGNSAIVSEKAEKSTKKIN